MILLLAGAVGALGLVNLLFRKSMLGILVGVQLLALGATLMFVLSGVTSGARVEGHLSGLFISLVGVAQLAAGYALSIRLFYQKNDVSLDDLRTLKR